jgi:hypothetical protein
MQDFEKLGVFYLGRPYDLATKKPGSGWLLYDSRDLVTHAVCVGMTGSGKTGLCLSLLEEAAIDGVPAIVIDPKGDLGNLMLTFPDLAPADFAPWVNPDDARRKGMTVDAFAEQQAALWKKGLGEWGQDGDRIRRLREAADFAIYTPGSEAGLPVSIMNTLAAPGPDTDGEAMRDRVMTTATSILGLLGIDADPVKSRDHILLSTLLSTAWQKGQDMDLATMIQQIQSPPVTRVGVFDLESFYPAKERFGLAMAINNLIASPGFSTWMTGEPLDVQSLLYTPEGKPRISIFAISHLGDAERMFFVSLLLNQVVGWMRAQSGTTSLRALVYMDEIMGYFPPVANPPSKLPLLTLLKQGRAFGVGVVLATQNPVDIDYKGLANAGTWFLGRLQTERDKARVLEGLEGAAATAGSTFDRGQMEQTLAALGSRIFLMNNVHEDKPVVFETRWAMSYLRGPLGRQEIKRLMDSKKSEYSRQSVGASQSMRSTQSVESGQSVGSTQSENASRSVGASQSMRSTQSVDAGQPMPTRQAVRAGQAAAVSGGAAIGAGASIGGGAGLQARGSATPPILPPGIDQYFLPVRGETPDGAQLVYAPMLMGSAQIRFADAKAGVDAAETVNVLTPVTDAAVSVDWGAAENCDFGPSDLEREATAGAMFDELPAAAGKAKNIDGWRKAFGTWLYGSRKLTLFQSAEPKLTSQAGETEGQFRVRLQQLAREGRDAAVEELRAQYAPKVASLQERLRRAQVAQEREAGQASAAKLQTAISFGATLLGAFMGRKAVSASTIGKATTAARGVGRSMKEAEDVKRAADTVGAVQDQLTALDAELQAQIASIESRSSTAPLQSVTFTPKKTGISVQLVALTWVPFWQASDGTRASAT